MVGTSFGGEHSWCQCLACVKELQEARQQAFASMTLQALQAAGSLNLTQPLVLAADTTIAGGTIRGGSVEVVRGATVTLRGMRLEGSRVVARGAGTMVVLEGVEISRSRDHGIHVAGGASVQAEGGRVEGSGRSGVFVVGEGSTVSLRGVAVEGSGEYGINAAEGGVASLAGDCTVSSSAIRNIFADDGSWIELPCHCPSHKGGELVAHTSLGGEHSWCLACRAEAEGDWQAALQAYDAAVAIAPLNNELQEARQQAFVSMALTCHGHLGDK